MIWNIMDYDLKCEINITSCLVTCPTWEIVYYRCVQYTPKTHYSTFTNGIDRYWPKYGAGRKSAIYKSIDPLGQQIRQCQRVVKK